METTEQTVFVARAAAVADAARRVGVSLRKAPQGFELIVETAAGHVSFPVVTDERDWRKTTAEEAFYGLLLDAHEWAQAQLPDSALALGVGEASEVPAMRREEATAIQRLEALSALLGGNDRLNAVFNAAGLSPLAL